ncbi:hypothetical protein BKA81DRAFT_374468 [Phyllosticta paracitricarpa]
MHPTGDQGSITRESLSPVAHSPKPDFSDASPPLLQKRSTIGRKTCSERTRRRRRRGEGRSTPATVDGSTIVAAVDTIRKPSKQRPRMVGGHFFFTLISHRSPLSWVTVPTRWNGARGPSRSLLSALNRESVPTTDQTAFRGMVAGAAHDKHYRLGALLFLLSRLATISTDKNYFLPV